MSRDPPPGHARLTVTVVERVRVHDTRDVGLLSWAAHAVMSGTPAFRGSGRCWRPGVAWGIGAWRLAGRWR